MQRQIFDKSYVCCHLVQRRLLDFTPGLLYSGDVLVVMLPCECDIPDCFSRVSLCYTKALYDEDGLIDPETGRFTDLILLDVLHLFKREKCN